MDLYCPNTGNTTLTNVDVIDDQGVSVSCPLTTLAPGEQMTCSASGIADDLFNTSFTTVPGLCENTPASPLYENIGVATGETSSGDTVEDADPSHYCNPPLNTCLVVIDEDRIDNGMSTIEDAAASHGVTPDFLVNDDMPTEVGNPPMRWNQLFAGDIVQLPTGEVDDEGWFALPPPPIMYVDGNSTNLTYDEWIAAFAAGQLPQDQLDKVANVMPLRNQELVRLVGRTCVAIVYDSDITMDYLPIYANLQGERYGAFTFTVLAVEVPGSIPESQ